MKKTRLLRTIAAPLALAAALSAPHASAAAPQAPLPDADPAMWVIKDADTTVYLFGTFHMLDGKSDWFNDEVKAAFDGSGELVLEAILPENPAEAAPIVARYAVDPNGRKLSRRLTPELKARVDAELKAMGVPPEAMEPMEPWFISMTISASAIQRKLGVSGEHGPEGALLKSARATGKGVAELEGVESQLKMFDSLPEEQQVTFLGYALDSIGRIESELRPMLAAWSTGKVEQLVAMQNAGLEKHPDIYRRIYADRNARWSEWIAKRMEKPGTVFVAVGVGHLAGKESVQDYLARRGIAASRVAASRAVRGR